MFCASTRRESSYRKEGVWVSELWSGSGSLVDFGGGIEELTTSLASASVASARLIAVFLCSPVNDGRASSCWVRSAATSL